LEGDSNNMAKLVHFGRFIELAAALGDILITFLAIFSVFIYLPGFFREQGRRVQDPVHIDLDHAGDDNLGQLPQAGPDNDDNHGAGAGALQVNRPRVRLSIV
jgi:hypothetical protein